MGDPSETVCSSLVDVDRRFPTVFRRKALHADQIEILDRWDGLCFWDCGPIEPEHGEVPWPEIKAHHSDGPETFSVSYRIAFCGPSCQLAWILDQNNYDSALRKLALKSFAIKKMGVRTEYAPAAPRSALKCFSPKHGIFENYRDFRNGNRVAVHIEREFPLIPHSIVWEERVIRLENGGNALPEQGISTLSNSGFAQSTRSASCPVGEMATNGSGGCFRSQDFVSPAMKPFPIRGRQLPRQPRSPTRERLKPPSAEVEPLFQRFVDDALAGTENEASSSVKQDAVRADQQSQKRRKPSTKTPNSSAKSRKKEPAAKKSSADASSSTNGIVDSQ